MLHLLKAPRWLVRLYLITLMGYVFIYSSAGQERAIPEVNVSISQGNLLEAVYALNQSSEFQVFADSTFASVPVSQYTFVRAPVDSVLNVLLSETEYSFVSYRNYVFVIAPRSAIGENRSTAYYQALEESIEVQDEDLIAGLVIGSVDQVESGGRTVMRGSIIDGEDQTPVIGATIMIKELQQGSASDEDGRFEIQLAPGNYTMAVRYVGYRNRDIPITVISSGNAEITLEKSSILLDEVLVQAKARDENVSAVQAGVSRVSTKEIEKLPSFLGEVDIIKSLLLQPGVSTIGEGSGGFHVRGGNIDQNLIMIDEGILFNPSHALGFFSAFNSDILSDALLFKGNVPAKYGGRLASVLDLNVRDGNFEKLRLKGGVGPVSSRFSIEGPLVENKTSALFAVRSSYSDWVLRRINVPEIRESSVFFYDANLRLVHRFNDKNNVAVAAYASEDRFTYADQFGFDYNTLMLQGTYRKVFGQKVLSTLSTIWSRYESEQLDLEGGDASRLKLTNQYLKVKENIGYNGDGFSADFGVSSILYLIKPGELEPSGSLSIIRPKSLLQEEGLESALYANIEIELSTRISMSGGLRLSLYQFFGPREMFLYANPDQPSVDNILEKTTLRDNVIHSEQNLEPRISARYRIDAGSSVKLGYARTSQYLNQISNNETPTPTSLWQLTNQYISPHLAHNFTIGYFRNFNENLWITSFEAFYRDIDRLFDYRDFADLIVNDHIETELVKGVGRAYGIELGIKKQIGTLNGWLNYTYSRSERRIIGINQGEWYPANFDKPHDLSLVCNLQINRRNQISINFNYSTGRPITVPVDRHVLEGRFGILNYSTRNAYRIPDYHRLDLSYTLGQGFRRSKKFKTSWTFSVYNLYSRRNAFSVFLQQRSRFEPQVKRLSVLGSAFPSLTFNFELL